MPQKLSWTVNSNSERNYLRKKKKVRIFMHQATMVLVDNNKQYKSNQIETIIISQTRKLEVRLNKS